MVDLEYDPHYCVYSLLRCTAAPLRRCLLIYYGALLYVFELLILYMVQL